MEQVAITVPGMDSPDRERAVTSAIISVPGVQWATAIATDGVVAVGFDPVATDVDELREAVASTRFETVA